MSTVDEHKNLDTEGCNLLRAAVVERAVMDYYSALKEAEQHPRNYEAKRTIDECERFFRSGTLEFWTDIDGELIIKATRERAGTDRRIRLDRKG